MKIKSPFYANEFIYFLSQWVPIKSLRRRVKGRIRYKIDHPKVAKHLLQNYIEPYFKERLQTQIFQPKMKFETPKIIWQLWFQGESAAPQSVKVCLESVKKQMGDSYKIIVLDKDSIKDYLDFPNSVYQKVLDKNFAPKPITIFSDLLRVALLSVYGGIWMDATLYCTAPLPMEVTEEEFYAPMRSSIPLSDYKEWIEFDPHYFCWEEDFLVRMLSSLLVAKANNPLIVAMRDILMMYFINEPKHIHYYVFQILFTLLCKSGKFDAYIPKDSNDTDIHLLHFYAKEKWNQQRWDFICSKTPVHKLTNMELCKGRGQMIDNLLERDKCTIR